MELLLWACVGLLLLTAALLARVQSKCHAKKEYRTLSPSVCLRLLPRFTRARLLDYLQAHLGESAEWDAMSDQRMRALVGEIAKLQMDDDVHEHLAETAGASLRSLCSQEPATEPPVQVRRQVSHMQATSPRQSVGGPSDWFGPKVVVSYNSGQEDLMRRLVAALEAEGIQTVDGTRTPAGKDWRRFYFKALSRATVYLPILSDTFLFSRACEDECTYAWDKNKIFVPVLHDFQRFSDVMRNPSQYTSRRADIDEVVPKMESFLNQCNRIPAVGRFEDAFDANLKMLVSRLRQALDETSTEQPTSDPEDVPDGMLVRSHSGGESLGAEQAATIVHQLQNHEKTGSALSSVRFLSHQTACRKLLVEAGLCPVLVTLFQQQFEGSTGEAHVIRDILFVLQVLTGRPDYLPLIGQPRFLSEWDPPALELLDHGVLGPLVKVVSAEHATDMGGFVCKRVHRVAAMNVLSNLGRTFKYKSAARIAEDDTLLDCLPPKLLDFRLREDERAAAFLLLSTVLRPGSEQVLRRLYDLQVVELLQAAIRDKSSEVVVEKSLWALGNFAQSSEFKAAVLQQTMDGIMGMLHDPQANIPLKSTALQFLAFGFDKISDDLCAKVLSSPLVLQQLAANLHSHHAETEYTVANIHGSAFNTARFNQHRWACVSMDRLSMVPSGRAAVLEQVHGQDVVHALMLLANHAQNDERGNRLLISESGSAALRMLKLFGERDEAVQAIHDEYVRIAESGCPSVESKRNSEFI